MGAGTPTRYGDGKRIAVGRPLGQGGMGVVYEAYDRESARRIALKIYSLSEPIIAARVRDVFERLRDLRHPNVVELLELFQQRDELQLAMELVEGEDFLTYCRAHRDADSVGGDGLRCDEARLRAALPQLASGLRALHTRDVVHRDVKPDNVRVTPDGRVVLLDFSLSRERGYDSSSHRSVAGTVAYMAPEQTDSTHGTTPAADWYGFGVMLYEALVGQVPFIGPPLRVLQQKSTVAAVSVRQLVPDAPADLAALCDALLAIDPDQRPTGDEVATQLGLASSPAGHRGRPESRVADEQLVGRAAELAALLRAFEEALLHRAQIVWLRGPDGSGKTALIDELLDRIEERWSPAVCLRGVGLSAAPTSPDPFDAIAAQLSDFWREAGVEEQIALLPSDAAPLREMFPALGRVPVVAGVKPRFEHGDAQAKRTAAFGALRQTLSQLARRRPLVVVLDDADLMPLASLTLLAELLRPPDPPPFLLLLASAGRAPALASTVEASRAPLEEIELGPMSGEEIGEMLRRRGRAELSDALVRAVGGSPRRALRLAFSGDDGPAADDDESWVEVRVAGLTPEARRLLELLAIAELPIGLEQAAAAADFGASQTRAAVDELARAQLIHSSAGDGELSCDHLVRGVVLAGVDETHQRAHARALAAMAGRDLASGVDALLWQRAGDGARLYASAKRAAAIAAEKLRFERAAAFYRMAAGAAGVSARERRELETSLADMLVAAGQAAEAGALLVELADDASSVERTSLLANAAKLILLSGDVDSGIEIFRRALNELDTDLSVGPTRALVALLRHRMWLRLRGLRWSERSAFELSQKQLLLGDVGLAAAYFIGLVDTIRGAELHARTLARGLRLGEPRLIARASALEAVYLAAQGAEGRAQAHAELALAIADKLHDDDIRAYATIGLGAVDYFGRSAWRSTLARLESIDDHYRARPLMSILELDILQTYSCFSLLNLGEMSELSRRLFAHLREADRRGDAYAGFVFRTRLVLAWLARDDVDGAERALDQAEADWRLADRGYYVQHWYWLSGRCELALYRGDPQAAVAVLAEDEPRLRRSYLLRVAVVRLEVESLQARVALACAAMAGAEQRKGLLRRLGHLERSLRRSKVPIGAAQADLVAGCERALLGDADAAVARLRRAAEGFDANEMGLWASAARYRIGRVAGGEEGENEVAAALAAMRRRGVERPERMAQLLAPGVV